MAQNHTLPLATISSLALLGGKGHSLGQLSSAGFPVPDGFHVTTDAYRFFIDENEFRDELQCLARPVVSGGRLSFDDAATRIRGLFETGVIPDAVRVQIEQAYDPFSADPVAVRSSATAEDLPDLSFAGQQDTYLHVNGRAALLDAVQNCWISLWTSRALAYRHRMGISNEQIAMAVVVQQMIPAQVSGVLFTANPATGARDEMIVNASYGLGEAIVSGEVTPDSFILGRDLFTVNSSVIGAKEQMVIADERQGTRFASVPGEDREKASLGSNELKQLHDLACKIERHFDRGPQDIEWLFADGRPWLLQSRPITNLPPPPLKEVRWEAPEPGAFLGRSQLVEHIPGPVSPLFEDLHMKISLQHYWGMNLCKRGGYEYVDTQPPACFVVQTTINGYAYRHLGPPPQTNRKHPGATWFSTRWRQFRIWFLGIPEWRYIALPRYLRTISHWRKLDLPSATPEQLRAGIRALSMADARYWYDGGVWHAFSMTRGTEFQLQNFLQEHSDRKFSSGQFLSGLKSPAYEAHVTLWRIAQQIGRDEQLYDAVIMAAPAKLLEVVGKGNQEISRQIDGYFRQYGHQIFTLDFADPCEAENPDNIARSLHGLLLQENYDPINNQRELTNRRRDTLRAAKRYFTGKLYWQFRKKLWLARFYYPNREEAMFHLGEAWTVLRPMAQELGKRLQAVGTLRRPDDIFFLNTDELGRAIRALIAGDGLTEYRQVTADRQQLREARRGLSPPVHVGKVPFWLKDRVSEDESQDPVSDVLEGSPVSPGQVTAPASLVLTQADFDKMKTGTILVCPTTTPAWTQLFPQAVGLVTDIGGILAHGSIVAREYGIPAVLGLKNATRRITDGQLITVDGDNGIVTLLDTE